jgi:hypothetical protein
VKSVLLLAEAKARRILRTNMLCPLQYCNTVFAERSVNRASKIMGPLMMRYYFQLSEASAMRDPVEVRACVNESVDSKPSSIDYDVAPRSPIGRKLYLSLQNTILWHCLWRSPAGTRTRLPGMALSEMSVMQTSLPPYQAHQKGLSWLAATGLGVNSGRGDLCV